MSGEVWRTPTGDVGVELYRAAQGNPPAVRLLMCGRPPHVWEEQLHSLSDLQRELARYEGARGGSSSSQ